MQSDQTPFGPGDEDRATTANNPLMRAALLFVKGDWSEFTHTFGLPTWGSLWNPCFCSKATRDEMRNIGDVSPTSGPFEAKTAEGYDEACSGCERLVWVADKKTLSVLVGSLVF